MRRAALAIQFNWIFVLLVGVVLFGFFLVLAGKQKELAEERQARELAQHLDAHLKTQGSDLVKPLALPKSALGLTCDPEDGTSTLRAGRISRDLRFQLVFGPDRPEGSRLFLWSTLWTLPAPVTSALHIVDGAWRLIILDDEAGFGAHLAQDLPAELEATLVAAGGVPAPPDRRGARYTLVKVRPWTESLQPPYSFNLNAFEGQDAPVTTVEVFTDPSTYHAGLVRFWVRPEGQRRETSYFLGKALFLGALTAHDPAQYRCNLGKALLHLTRSLALLQDRLAQLQAVYGGDNPCAYLYGPPEAVFTDPNGGLEELLRQLRTEPVDAGDEAALLDLLKRIDAQFRQLERYNNMVSRGPKDCPYLF